ncbi:addiction module protein [Leucobacter sp. BZR 635]
MFGAPLPHVTSTAALSREGRALGADQHAAVANALLESLHDIPEPREARDAWTAVAVRRLDEVRSGEVGLVDADEH